MIPSFCKISVAIDWACCNVCTILLFSTVVQLLSDTITSKALDIICKLTTDSLTPKIFKSQTKKSVLQCIRYADFACIFYILGEHQLLLLQSEND